MPHVLSQETGSKPEGKREEWIKELCTNYEQFLSAKGQRQLPDSSPLLFSTHEYKKIINTSIQGKLGTFVQCKRKVCNILSL